MSEEGTRQTEAPHAVPRGGGMDWQAVGGALLILGLTLIVYAPAMRGGFVWDDDEHFSENPLMREWSGIWGIWTGHQFYYPLTSTSFWLIARLWGIQPLAYHLPGIVLHALNAILLWRILRRAGIGWAWLCGLAFALHPVHTQSVAWATELKNTQSGLFYLLSIRCFQSLMESGRGAHRWWSLGFFAAALLSKTSTVTLPLTLTVLWLWQGGRGFRAAAARLAPYYALALLAGAATILLHRGQVSGADWNETPGERLLLAARSVWFYAGKLAWPGVLTFVYPRWELGGSRALWLIPPAGLAAAILASALARNPAAQRGALLGGALFIANLLPVLNFFRMYYTRYAYVADHWQYLASMAAIPLMVSVGRAMWLRAEGVTRGLALFLCAVVVAVLGVGTLRQSTEYRDVDTLWNATIRKNPRAGVAYSNLGLILIERGELDAAVALLTRGMEAVPESPAIRSNLALAALGQGRLEEAERIAREVIAAHPDEIMTHNTLAGALLRQGRTREAAETLRSALARDPDNEVLRGNLDQIEAMQGAPPP